MATSFDIFTVRQWREGYTLEVNISRPRNAPSFKHTEADRKRRAASAKMNYEHLANKIFPTLEDVMKEIKKLEIQ